MEDGLLVGNVFREELRTFNCTNGLFDKLIHDIPNRFRTVQSTIQILTTYIELLRDRIEIFIIEKPVARTIGTLPTQDSGIK